MTTPEDAPCKRPLCKSPGAEADHVVVMRDMRIPICAMCAVDARQQGLNAISLAEDNPHDR